MLDSDALQSQDTLKLQKGDLELIMKDYIIVII